MIDYSPVIRAAVANGTVFASAAKTQLSGLNGQLQTASGTLSGDLQTRLQTALGKFQGLETHMASQTTNFSRNMSVFAEMAKGKAQVEVTSFFGSQFGGAQNLTAQAQTALAGMTASPTASVEAIEALANQAQTMVTTETATISSSIEAIKIESLVQTINSSLNTEMGSLMLQNMGGPAIQAILAERIVPAFDESKTIDDFLDQYGQGDGQ